MSDNKQNRSFRGYYIALILCAAAIGITGYVASRKNEDPATVSVEETWEDVLAGTLGTEDVAVIATQPQTTATFPTPSVTPKETQPKSTTPAKQPLKPVSPVSGNEINGYSMEALSYNQTTRDWRVHNGIDLAAEAGTQVLASADGEVFSVTEDDYLGHTVTIRHSDGYTTCYSSLAEDISVKPGDTVTAGQVIGCVGDSAITETALGDHLHFSVTRHEAPIDPAEFLALGE